MYMKRIHWQFGVRFIFLLLEGHCVECISLFLQTTSWNLPEAVFFLPNVCLHLYKSINFPDIFAFEQIFAKCISMSFQVFVFNNFYKIFICFLEFMIGLKICIYGLFYSRKGRPKMISRKSLHIYRVLSNIPQ